MPPTQTADDRLQDNHLPIGTVRHYSADRGADGLRVLIVDDHPDTVETLAALLEIWGHSPQIARSGREALTAALQLLPHVVLLDLGLPGLGGFQVARQLRSEPHLPQPLLIAVSGYCQATYREAAGAAGIDHFLVKPEVTEELRGLLEQVSATRGSRRP